MNPTDVMQLERATGEIKTRKSFIEKMELLKVDTEERLSNLEDLRKLGRQVLERANEAQDTSDPTKRAGIKAIAEDLLQQIFTHLNDESANGHVFSGSRRNIPAVDLTKIEDLNTLNYDDTDLKDETAGEYPDWYQGDRQIQTGTRISRTQTLQDRVKANELGLQDLVKAANILANTDPAHIDYTTRAREANRVSERGLRGTESLVGDVAALSGQLKSVMRNHENAVLSAEKTVARINGIDRTESYAWASTLESSERAGMAIQKAQDDLAMASLNTLIRIS